jgi:excisionase family DNA binding protein
MNDTSPREEGSGETSGWRPFEGNTGSGDRLLSARELGELIGLATGTVLDWWQAGRIPGFKIGGRAVRFSLREVQDWLADCHVEARR